MQPCNRGKFRNWDRVDSRLCTKMLSSTLCYFVFKSPGNLVDVNNLRNFWGQKSSFGFGVKPFPWKNIEFCPYVLKWCRLYTSTTFTWTQAKLYSGHWKDREKESIEAKFSFCFNPLSKFTSCFTQTSANSGRDYLLNMYKHVLNSAWTNTQ